MKRLMYLAVLMSVCSVCSLCWGQSMDNDSSVSGNGQFVDNFVNLSNSAYNLWHNTNAALTSIGVSSTDGFAAGTDASGCWWTFPNDYPTHTAWTQHTAWGCGWTNVVVEDATHGYGLKLSGCPNGYCLSRFNLNTGGVATINTSGLDGGLSVAQDGSHLILAIDNGGLYKHSGADNSGFQPVPGTSGFTWVADAAVSSTWFFAARSDGTVWTTHDGGTSWTQIQSLSGITKLAIAANSDPGPDVWALGPTVSGGNVYRNSGSGWVRVYGQVANSIAVTPFQIGGIWITTASGGQYRASMYGWKATGTYTSHTICHNASGLVIPCSQINPSNPPIHTPNITCCFTGGKHIGGGTAVGSGASPDTVTHVSLGDTCGDPLAMFEISPIDCVLDAGSGGWTKCTMLGSIFQLAVGGILGGIKPVNWGIFRVTHMMVPNPQVGHGCYPAIGNLTNCGYYVIPECPNPPPYAFVDREVRYFKQITEQNPSFWGWIANDQCFKFKNNTYTCIGSWNSPLGGDPAMWCATPADVLALP